MTAYKSQPRVRVSFRGMSFVDYHVNLVTLHTYYKLQKLILRLDLMSVKWDKGQSVFMIPLNCIKMWLISARNINQFPYELVENRAVTLSAHFYFKVKVTPQHTPPGRQFRQGTFRGYCQFSGCLPGKQSQDMITNVTQGEM